MNGVRRYAPGTPAAPHIQALAAKSQSLPMKIKEFKFRYISSLPKNIDIQSLGLDQFYLYQRSTLKDAKLKIEDINQLENIGMPAQASPFLHFNDYSEWEYDDDQYFPIGADGSGNNICINHESGNIVLLDHDWSMKRIFINSTLNNFSECLCIYQEALSSQNMNTCLEKMTIVDANLHHDSEWWSNQIASS